MVVNVNKTNLPFGTLECSCRFQFWFNHVLFQTFLSAFPPFIFFSRVQRKKNPNEGNYSKKRIPYKLKRVKRKRHFGKSVCHVISVYTRFPSSIFCYPSWWQTTSDTRTQHLILCANAHRRPANSRTFCSQLKRSQLTHTLKREEKLFLTQFLYASSQKKKHLLCDVRQKGKKCRQPRQ